MSPFPHPFVRVPGARRLNGDVAALVASSVLFAMSLLSRDAREPRRGALRTVAAQRPGTTLVPRHGISAGH
jgi:hypothetical protein